MKYLLDTHAFIWSFRNAEKLSKKVYEVISDAENEIFLSSISLWEIAIKYQLKKLDLGNLEIYHLPNIADEYNFSILVPEPYDFITYSELPLKKEHRDPFDRLLIHTAIRNNLVLISKDKKFEQYKKDGLQMMW